MADELRWILLAAGSMLVAALWWWERRRPAPSGEEPAQRVPERFEPRLEAEPAAPPVSLAVVSGDPAAPPSEPLQYGDVAIRASEEGRVQRIDPRVVMIENLPDNVEDVVLTDLIDVDEQQALEQEPVLPVLEAPVGFATPPPPPAEAPEPPAAKTPPAEPWPLPAVEPPVARPIPEPVRPVAADPLADAIVERPRPTVTEPPTRQQHIVAIRMVALPERKIDGGELKQALAVEGLVFGRYSIFHRMLDGERPIYSVASLIEPGSFEPDLMASTRLPGVSMFAVFPGPLPAPKTFDDLLATARRLADRLGGVLQDDAGSSLTGQRVLNIREDLVQFEHLVTLSRARRSN